MDVIMPDMETIIIGALHEDLGSGDITTQSIVDEDLRLTAKISAEGSGIAAGLFCAAYVFKYLDKENHTRFLKNDGSFFERGDVLFTVSGSARAVLSGERVALNFLQRLSGIATRTNQYVQAVKDFPAQILDTRKTTPGLRTLEKYAVRTGGGINHRFGLFDGILIKDNHIEAAGSITSAVKSVRAYSHPGKRIEVEAETLDQVREALACGVDLILLDNMNPQEIRRSVEVIAGRAKTEASGGITLDNVTDIAAAGVDFISIGELTHSVKAVDISLEIAHREH